MLSFSNRNSLSFLGWNCFHSRTEIAFIFGPGNASYFRVESYFQPVNVRISGRECFHFVTGNFYLFDQEPLFSIETPELPFTLLNEKHVKWQVNGNVEIIGWNRAETYAENLPSQLAVNLSFNEFRGKRKIQLNIQDSQI